MTHWLSLKQHLHQRFQRRLTSLKDLRDLYILIFFQWESFAIRLRRKYKLAQVDIKDLIKDSCTIARNLHVIVIIFSLPTPTCRNCNVIACITLTCGMLSKKFKENVKINSVRDKTYSFVNTIKGTPAYWKKFLHEVWAMVKQLGIPTFCLILAFSDLRWNELI